MCAERTQLQHELPSDQPAAFKSLWIDLWNARDRAPVAPPAGSYRLRAGWTL